MDECPPPFVVPPPDEDDEVAAFDASYSSVGEALDALKLPSVSRSPSPSPIPKSNGVRHHDEKENDDEFDAPPPLRMDTIKDLPISSPGGGIESFLEREAIKSDDLPVDCIGLSSPAASREPSPCLVRSEPEPGIGKEEPGIGIEKEEAALPNGLDEADHAAVPPREDDPEVDQPLEVDQPAPEPIDNEDEEDDDFGDFGFAPPPPPVDHKKDLSTVTEEDDDWAAFQSSSAAAVSERKSTTVADDGDDDWAAFEAAAPAVAERQPSLDDNDDWATDFASAPPPVAAPAAVPVVEVPTLPSLAELSIDEGIWAAESTVEEEEDGFAFDLYAQLDAEDLRGSKGEKGGKGDEEEMLNPSSVLWFALRIVEEAAALRHTWEGSTAARELMQLLKISASRPLQRAQLAAAIPSADAVLQPTRPGEMNGKSAARTVTLSTSASSASHAASPYSSASVSTPSSSSTNTTTGATSSTSLGSGCLVPSTSTLSTSPSARSPSTAESFVAPPVDFDWEKSNLKTPAMQQSSSATMLDMDYFAAAGGAPKIISSDSTLQRDLESFGLSATSASASKPRVESTPSVLDTILSSARASSSAASSTPRYLAPSELSLDARALHDALPSLDHLAAAWISFPLRDQGDS